MMTIADLRAALPQSLSRFLVAEQTNPQRLAPWLEAASSMQIGSLNRICKSYRFSEGCLFPQPLRWGIRRIVARLLDVNRTALQILNDSSKTSPFVTLPITLDDFVPLSEEDYRILSSQLPPLLALQGLEAHYLVCTGKTSDALSKIQNVFTTATQLLVSSIQGIVNHEGLYHLHGAYVAALELANAICNDRDSILLDLITEAETRRVSAVDYVGTQMLQYCANVIYAVWNCPDTQDVSEIVQYLHNSRHLIGVLFPVSAEEVGASSFVIENVQQPQQCNDEELRILAQQLLENHQCPFDKSATLAELRDTFFAPWSQLDNEPSEVRRLCATMISSDFYSGVHRDFAAVIAGGRYVSSNVRCESEGAIISTRGVLSNMRNPIGKALGFEVRRIFYQHLAVTMGCWYYLRLIQEVTRSLLGIKAFAFRIGRLPTRLSEVVEVGVIETVPRDPYSRIELQYEPDLQIVRVSPSSNEVSEWPIDRSRNPDFTWRLLSWASV